MGEIPACPERGGTSNLEYTPLNSCRGRTHTYSRCSYTRNVQLRRRGFEPQGDNRSLERHCGQGNRPMSFRGVKRRGNPLNRNKNRLTIATNRISPRAYYRAENLRYQFEQGQELLPQLRQIICLVKVGRDTHTRLNYILPLVIPSNAEESRRKPHFATLDSSLRYSQQLCLCIETYGFRL